VAITYENVIDRVIDGVSDLLATEFPGTGIYFDEIRGNSFLILPGGDEYISSFAMGQAREYTLEIIYELRVEILSKSKFKELTNIIERIKRLFAPDNNSNYSPSGTYKWHDGRITSIDYSRDEESPEILRAILTFQCVITETTS
tara:strand:- start:236 stop:667 length:432 start_codon:yes stop_codon:yes gene_type:complete